MEVAGGLEVESHLPGTDLLELGQPRVSSVVILTSQNPDKGRVPRKRRHSLGPSPKHPDTDF